MKKEKNKREETNDYLFISSEDMCTIFGISIPVSVSLILGAAMCL